MSKLVTETLLGEKHMVDIIVYLRSFGSRSRTEIYRAISTSPHMARKIDTLQDYGLVSVKCTDSSNKKLLHLTPLGNAYADAICDLENRSGGNIDAYRSDTVKEMLAKMERLN